MTDSRPGRYGGYVEVMQPGSVLARLWDLDEEDGAIFATLPFNHGTWTGPPPAEGDEVLVNTRTMDGVETMDVEVIREPLTDEERAGIDRAIEALEKSL